MNATTGTHFAVLSGFAKYDYKTSSNRYLQPANVKRWLKILTRVQNRPLRSALLPSAGPLPRPDAFSGPLRQLRPFCCPVPKLPSHTTLRHYSRFLQRNQPLDLTLVSPAAHLTKRHHSRPPQFERACSPREVKPNSLLGRLRSEDWPLCYRTPYIAVLKCDE